MVSSTLLNFSYSLNFETLKAFNSNQIIIWLLHFLYFTSVILCGIDNWRRHRTFSANSTMESHWTYSAAPSVATSCDPFSSRSALSYSPTYVSSSDGNDYNSGFSYMIGSDFNAVTDFHHLSYHLFDLPLTNTSNYSRYRSLNDIAETNSVGQFYASKIIRSSFIRFWCFQYGFVL